MQNLNITFSLVFKPQHCTECECGERFSEFWPSLCAGEVLCGHFGRDQTCRFGVGEGQTELDENVAILYRDGIGQLFSVDYHR